MQTILFLVDKFGFYNYTFVNEETMLSIRYLVPLIYFDTNVYARPFDDQNRSTIQAEADAFLRLIRFVGRFEKGELE